jgi:hypothetical protein
MNQSKQSTETFPPDIPEELAGLGGMVSLGAPAGFRSLKKKG